MGLKSGFFFLPRGLLRESGFNQKQIWAFCLRLLSARKKASRPLCAGIKRLFLHHEVNLGILVALEDDYSCIYTMSFIRTFTGLPPTTPGFQFWILSTMERTYLSSGFNAPGHFPRILGPIRFPFVSTTYCTS